MDAKCTITCCDLLDIAVNIVLQRRYGVQCSTPNFCHISQYYLNDLRPTVISTPLYVKKSIQFINHECQEVDLTPSPVETYWLADDPYCVEIENTN